MTERQSITCPRCGRRSWHPEDVAQRYCGACCQFHHDLEPLGAEERQAVEPGDLAANLEELKRASREFAETVTAAWRAVLERAGLLR